MAGQFKNPPLIEALLEIKWKLKQVVPDTFEDPGYRLASGRLYDRINRRFGYIQNLPISAIPEELTAYTVRQQFRAGKNEWPLVQLGPGIASVNFTSPYTWKKFRDTIKFFLPHLVESYRGVISEDKDTTLEATSVLLRYINAVEMDWTQNNALEYLATNLHSTITLPENISGSDLIEGVPLNVNLQVGYPISKPKGQGIIRITNGKVGQSTGLVWELLFISAGAQTPQLTAMDDFITWLTDAHNILEKWFLALIEGDLEMLFKGEQKK